MRPATTAIFVTLLTISAGPAGAAPFVFTDWTSADLVGEVATGTLNGIGVTFSGSNLDGAILDGTSTTFSLPAFTPALPFSDAIGFQSNTPPMSYSLDFDAPVLNPIIHFRSLASTILFAGDLDIVRISGDERFSVSGSSVIGEYFEPGGLDPNRIQDAQGTIQLMGLFTALDFTATYVPPFGPQTVEGIALQVGMELEAEVPEPATWALLATGLTVLAARRRLRK